MKSVEVLIIGAGAAGLMCALEAGKRGRQVVVLDHANKAGKKILMSGGGRCNFTNLSVTRDNFISHNPFFCVSALSRYTPSDFIALVEKHQIEYYEKTLGQLFCKNKSKDILNLLLLECKNANVTLQLNTHINSVAKKDSGEFSVVTERGTFVCESLVIATGGLSIPTMGASPFGYCIAKQFGIPVWPTRAGLVPLTLHAQERERLSNLSGIAVNSLVQSQQKSFKENLLFTHRGLSGPAILQISSYWQPGESLTIKLLPEVNLFQFLLEKKSVQPEKMLKNALTDLFANKLLEMWLPPLLAQTKLQQFSSQQLQEVTNLFQAWPLTPNGTEGYRTAEVTLGGVDCNSISSKTFEALQVPGLYFIGEVLDVTGWLGGYNFQWAWASGYACGLVV